MSKARAIPHAFHKYLEVRETFTGIDWGDERLREPFIKFIDTFFRSTCVRPSRRGTCESVQHDENSVNRKESTDRVLDQGILLTTVKIPDSEISIDDTRPNRPMISETERRP